jgi:hypothetical protein
VIVTLGSFLKITEVAQILGCLFRSWGYALILAQKRVGLRFGLLFQKISSGHPALHTHIEFVDSLF